MQIQEKKEGMVDALKAARKEKFERHIHEAIGLRKVIQMISDSNKPTVGHNLFVDLLFIWSQLVHGLPPKLEGFAKELLAGFKTFSSKVFSPNNQNL